MNGRNKHAVVIFSAQETEKHMSTYRKEAAGREGGQSVSARPFPPEGSYFVLFPCVVLAPGSIIAPRLPLTLPRLDKETATSKTPSSMACSSRKAREIRGDTVCNTIQTKRPLPNFQSLCTITTALVPTITTTTTGGSVRSCTAFATKIPTAPACIQPASRLGHVAVDNRTNVRLNFRVPPPGRRLPHHQPARPHPTSLLCEPARMQHDYKKTTAVRSPWASRIESESTAC